MLQTSTANVFEQRTVGLHIEKCATEYKIWKRIVMNSNLVTSVASMRNHFETEQNTAVRGGINLGIDVTHK